MPTWVIIAGGIFLLFLGGFLYWKIWLYPGRAFVAPVLLFHKVEPVSEWGVTSLKPEKFGELISCLKDLGYSSVSPDEALKLEPADRSKKLLITFDDAYSGVYDHAGPILDRFGFSSTVFVITGFVGKSNSWDMNLGGKKYQHLGWEQIRELAQRGFTIGSHTVNHPDLTRLSLLKVQYELRKSKEDLEGQLGRKVAYLSYPFGRCNSRIQAEAKRLGYQAGFSIFPGRSCRLDPSLAIKRTAIYRIDSPLSLRIKLEGGPWFWLEDLKGYLINRLSLATSLIKPLPDYTS